MSEQVPVGLAPSDSLQVMLPLCGGGVLALSFTLPFPVPSKFTVSVVVVGAAAVNVADTE